MKRDMDLVRKILRIFEERDKVSLAKKLDIDGYAPDCVEYHLHLMVQADLLEDPTAELQRSFTVGGRMTAVHSGGLSLTWAGHDFLDASRNESTWEKAKRAAGTAGGMSFDVLKAVLIGLATAAAKKAAGLP
jgi:hypothetical protein